VTHVGPSRTWRPAAPRGLVATALLSLLAASRVLAGPMAHDPLPTWPDVRIEDEVEHFLRGHSSHWCWPPRYSAGDLAVIQGRLPDDPYGVRLPSGETLLRAGQPHNDDAASALLYGPDGRLEAVAVDSCARDPTGPYDWHTRVYIYVRDDGHASEYVGRFRGWRGFNTVGSSDKVETVVERVRPRD